jgi:hypothetical protein
VHDWALPLPPAYDPGEGQVAYVNAAREVVYFYDWVVRACEELRREVVAGHPPAASIEPVF